MTTPTVAVPVEPPAREDAQPVARVSPDDMAQMTCFANNHGTVEDWHVWCRIRSALTTHPAPDALRVAVADIAAERNRQINAEGWSEAHDDEHDDYQMARAAGCYAFHASREDDDGDTGMFVSAAVHHGWPWDRAWWKPKSRRADLVRAGALIVAEIERLDRAALQAEQKGGAA